MELYVIKVFVIIQDLKVNQCLLFFLLVLFNFMLVSIKWRFLDSNCNKL